MQNSEGLVDEVNVYDIALTEKRSTGTEQQIIPDAPGKLEKQLQMRTCLETTV